MDGQVFLWNHTYWWVDTLSTPESHRGLSVLSVDVAEDQSSGNLEMPPFLEVLEEVTGDDRYMSFDIAKKPISFS